MSWYFKLFRWCFIVQEVSSEQGEVYSRRFCLFRLFSVAIFLDQLLKSDDCDDPYDSSFASSTIVLKGSFQEACWKPPFFSDQVVKVYYQGDVIEHKAEDAIKITLQSPVVWNLVIAHGKRRNWGYRLENVCWIHHKYYYLIKQKNRQKVIEYYQDERQD